MNLYANGKMSASYQITAGKIFSNGLTKWISSLEMTKEEATALRYLVKKEMTANESITFFSRLFGANMYIDFRMCDENAALWKSDVDGVIKEIADEKKSTKVKNHTKAVLVQEIPGLFQDYDEKTGTMRMVYPDETGEYRFSEIHCLAMINNVFEEIHSYTYPADIFGKESRYLNIDTIHNSVMVMDLDGFYDEYDWQSNKKRLTELMEIPAEKKAKSSEWTLCNPIYPMGMLEQWRASVSYDEPELENAFWSCDEKIPVITKSGVVDLKVIDIRGSKEKICRVYFYNQDLNLIRMEEITLYEDVFNFKYTYCEETDCIYFGNMKIDLKTHEVKRGMKELKEVRRLFLHYDAEKKCQVYAIKGSSVYVLDEDLNLLSSHRLKGDIFFYKEEKAVKLVTIGDVVYNERRPDKGEFVRVYEIN